MRTNIYFIATFVFCLLKAEAQEPSEKLFTGASILVDEDYFMEWFVKDVNKDRDYTGSGGLTFTGRFVEAAKINSLQKGVDYLFGLKKIHDSRKLTSFHALKFGETVFSPQGKDLNKTAPIYDDRPYASISYFSTSTLSMDSLKENALLTELSIGAFGWQGGRVSQAYIHSKVRGCDTCRPYDPVGWDNQISNGGEIALQYNISFKNLLTKPNKFTIGRDGSKFKLYDVFVSKDIYIGDYTALGAALTGRFGVIRSNWGLFNSSYFGAQSEAKGDLKLKKHNFEFYFFSTLRPKFIAYNAALQGLTKTSAHTFTFDEVNHFAFQYEGGICMTLPGWMSLNIVYAHRTSEFKGPKGLPHDWIGFNLNFHRPFYPKDK